MKSLKLSRFFHGGANVLGFQLIDPHMPGDVGFIKEWAELHQGAWSDVLKVCIREWAELHQGAWSRVLKVCVREWEGLY